MGFFDDITQNLARFLDWAGDSLRRITAIFFLMFALGMLSGYHVALRGDSISTALFAPILLAVISYFSTGAAVILFILVVTFIFFFI